MREIKFRWFIKPTAEDYHLHEDEPMTYSVTDLNGWLQSEDYKKGNVVCMQYIGLKDSQNEHIFNKDILQVKRDYVVVEEGDDVQEPVHRVVVNERSFESG